MDNQIAMILTYPEYGVDREGNVYSLRKGIRLTPKRNWDGYLRVQMWRHCRNTFVSIHRLVAETFIPNPEGNTVVNHKNGDKSDNRVINLEWCTQQENIQHAWATGLSHHRLNTQGKHVRQLNLHGQTIAEFPSTMEVERQLGFHHNKISAAIKRGGTCGGYRWEAMQQ